MSKSQMIKELRENKGSTITVKQMIERFDCSPSTANNYWKKDKHLQPVPGTYPHEFQYNWDYHRRKYDDDSPTDKRSVNAQYRDAANEIRAENAPTADHSNCFQYPRGITLESWRKVLDDYMEKYPNTTVKELIEGIVAHPESTVGAEASHIVKSLFILLQKKPEEIF